MGAYENNKPKIQIRGGMGNVYKNHDMKWIDSKCMIFILVLVMYSCSRPIDREIQKFMSDKTKIPYGEMVRRTCSLYSDTLESQCEYRLVNYIDMDSVNCGQCKFSVLEATERNLREDSSENVRIEYIVRCSAKELESSYRKICNARLQGIVYFDTVGVFLARNKSFPKETLLHTFLLNKNDSVVMVGNPYQNEKLKQLFKKIIK